MRNRNEIKNIAGSVKIFSVVLKGSLIALICLIFLAAGTYMVSYFYDRYSSFSVTVENYDMLKQALSLSDTPDFVNGTSKLNANAIQNCTNISADEIPENVDSVNGEHNGENYIAYTFYLKNSGIDTVTYEYSVYLLNVTKEIDEAIRIETIVDGEKNIYAKTKKDGSGAEEGTIEFATVSQAMIKRRAYFAPGDVTKFTIVIWIEGNDAECQDTIVGGRFKAEMKFTIVENS